MTTAIKTANVMDRKMTLVQVINNGEVVHLAHDMESALAYIEANS